LRKNAQKKALRPSKSREGFKALQSLIRQEGIKPISGLTCRSGIEPQDGVFVFEQTELNLRIRHHQINTRNQTMACCMLFDSASNSPNMQPHRSVGKFHHTPPLNGDNMNPPPKS
jgi:hypothetical protein